jgi:hypothetical protein
MPTRSERQPPIPPKLRRTLELVYGVEGVVAARVWQSAGHMAIGVRGGFATPPSSLLFRVEAAVAGLREPGETWDFGILEDGATGLAAANADGLTENTPPP